MQFFVYIAQPAAAPAGPSGPAAAPDPERMRAIMTFHEAAMRDGTIVATGRLDATSTRIRREAGELAISDGPFVEGDEQVPGFTIIEVPDREAALAWAAEYRDLMGMPELRLTPIRR